MANVGNIPYMDPMGISLPRGSLIIIPRIWGRRTQEPNAEPFMIWAQWRIHGSNPGSRFQTERTWHGNFKSTTNEETSTFGGPWKKKQKKTGWLWHLPFKYPFKKIVQLLMHHVLAPWNLIVEELLWCLWMRIPSAAIDILIPKKQGTCGDHFRLPRLNASHVK